MRPTASHGGRHLASQAFAVASGGGENFPQPNPTWENVGVPRESSGMRGRLCTFELHSMA